MGYIKNYMGIIQRQSLKRSIITYMGVIIGVISTLFIYPLDLEKYGLAQFLINTGTFIASFATLGISGLTVRFFPIFKDEPSRHHGFLGLLVWSSLLSLVLFWVLAASLNGPFYAFLDWGGFNAAVFSQNMPFIMLICAASVYMQLLELYASNFNRVAIPSIFSNLFLKAGLPLIILLAYWQLLEGRLFQGALAGLMLLAMLGLGGYLRHLNQWSLKLDLGFLKPALVREMAVYAFFGLAGSVGAIVAFRIDTIMVTTLIGERENGAYSIATFIANVIETPFTAMIAISAPIIAGAFARSAQGEVLQLYRKGSLNLLILGLYLCIGIWVCLDDLLRLTPRYEELRGAVQVVAFIGIAKLLTMTLGMSSYIIGFSRYFRFNLIPLFILAISNVLLNYWLIPKYAITGAAMATAISIGGFQLISFLFVWAVLGMQPFSWRSGVSVVLGVGTFAAGVAIPSLGHPLVNILAKGSVVTLLFLGPILGLRISPELNGMLQGIWEKGLGWLRRFR